MAIEIPQLNIANSEKRNQEITEYIENCLYKLTGYSFELSNVADMPASEQVEKYEHYVEIKSQIVLQEDECVSIVFEGMYNCRTAAHPTHLFFTYNFNPKSGERILYSDKYEIEDTLYEKCMRSIREKYGEEIKELFGVELVVPTTPFPRIKLADLYNELEKEFGYTVPDEEKCDLTTEAEKLSYEWCMKKYNHEFLFITDFGVEKRAFYHMRKDGIPQGYDLIWRGVEITTGAQREHRYDVLCEQAREKGLEEDVKFYLEFFKYGCPPHGGFGIGIDRMTMLLLGLHIKECMFLFRGPNRLNP